MRVFPLRPGDEKSAFCPDFDQIIFILAGRKMLVACRYLASIILPGYGICSMSGCLSAIYLSCSEFVVWVLVSTPELYVLLSAVSAACPAPKMISRFRKETSVRQNGSVSIFSGRLGVSLAAEMLCIFTGSFGHPLLPFFGKWIETNRDRRPKWWVRTKNLMDKAEEGDLC